MTQPTINTAGQALYDAIAPLAVSDEDHDWAALWLCSAIGAMVQGTDQVVLDSPTHPGWAAAFDPTVAPAPWLPWLAWLYGVTLVPGMTEAQQRATILTLPPHQRGTPASLVAIVAAYLTGTTFTATTTAGSPTLSGVSSFTNLNRGGVTNISGDGILTGTTISSLDPGTATLQMSQPATASATVTVTAKTIFLQERFGGDAYQLRLAVYASETHDYALAAASSPTYAAATVAFSTYTAAGAYGSSAVASELARAKPAGLLLTFDAITGGDYDSARDSHATYQAARSTYATYTAAHANPTQQ